MSDTDDDNGYKLARALLGEVVIDELEERGAKPSLELKPIEGGDLGDARTYFSEVSEGIESAQRRSQRMATMGELGAGVVHEVRNKVTAIKGFTDLARRKESNDEDLPKLLEKISSLTSDCMKSLSAFLGFVSGARDEVVAFDVNEVLEEAALLVRHQLSVHKVKLYVQCEQGLPSAIGRPGELVQVLINMAINAEQAMDEGGVVWFRSSQAEDGHLIVRVSDNGPGVPSDLRNKIFEPFFTTKERGLGAGLGLAISVRLIRDARGDINVGESSDGGAEFEIVLEPAVRG